MIPAARDDHGGIRAVRAGLAEVVNALHGPQRHLERVRGFTDAAAAAVEDVLT